MDNARLRALLAEAAKDCTAVPRDVFLTTLATESAKHPVVNALDNKKSLALDALDVSLSAFRSIVPAYDKAARSLGHKTLDHVALWSVYIPLAQYIIRAGSATPGCLTVVIVGVPGAGKTTLARIIELVLVCGFEKNTLRISSDDLYLPRSERLALGHKWRGPNTIDEALAAKLFRSLRAGATALDVPRYDIELDDRRCIERIRGIPSVCLFEGWLAGFVASEVSKSVGELPGLTIYIDIEIEIAKAARFRREREARQQSRGIKGITSEEMDLFWQQSIEPAIAQYTMPWRQEANIVIHADEKHMPKAITTLSTQTS